MHAHTKVQNEPKPDRRASVGYIGTMSRELAAMARKEGCGFLAYMLEVAAIEAERMAGASQKAVRFLQRRIADQARRRPRRARKLSQDFLRRQAAGEALIRPNVFHRPIAPQHNFPLSNA